MNETLKFMYKQLVYLFLASIMLAVYSDGSNSDKVTVMRFTGASSIAEAIQLSQKTKPHKKID